MLPSAYHPMTHQVYSSRVYLSEYSCTIIGTRVVVFNAHKPRARPLRTRHGDAMLLIIDAKAVTTLRDQTIPMRTVS